MGNWQNILDLSPVTKRIDSGEIETWEAIPLMVPIIRAESFMESFLEDFYDLEQWESMAKADPATEPNLSDEVESLWYDLRSWLTTSGSGSRLAILFSRSRPERRERINNGRTELLLRRHRPRPMLGWDYHPAKPRLLMLLRHVAKH